MSAKPPGQRLQQLPNRPRPLVLAIALALSSPPALAATIAVNDASSGSTTNCTLTDAVTAANTDTAINGCAPGSGTDLILFDSTISGSTIAPGQQLDISSDLTIDGSGRDITLSGGKAHRVLHVASGQTATLKGLTIRDGHDEYLYGSYYHGSGGGISNDGNLTVQDSTLLGNSASSGGGIGNNGTLTVQDSTLSGNSVIYGGGGISNRRGTLTVQDSTLSGNSVFFNGGGISNHRGTLTVQDSTLSGNSAYFYGGGIDNYLGTLTLLNSTLSGNSAGAYGGGIFNSGSLTAQDSALTIQDSTLSGNSASEGGGIYLRNGTLTLRNSTLSGNSASSTGGGLHTISGTANHISNSVIANSTGGDCDLGSTLDTNTVNWFADASCDNTADGEPQLQPLADNGGPTLTHLPLTGSGLIDASDSDTCTETDQRGVKRPEDGDMDGTVICDIGAVEVVYKIDQTITGFAADPASGIVGDCVTLSVTSSGDSGNPVIYASTTPSICTVNADTVGLIAAGTCTLTADQDGDKIYYNPAPTVPLDVEVYKIDQAITGFTADPAFGIVGDSVTLSVTGSGASGNPVVYASTTPALCGVTNDKVNLLKAGTCKVTADQAGSDDYNPAPSEALDIDIRLTLTVELSSRGNVQSTEPGIDCTGPDTCSATFSKDLSFDLTATPDSNWDSWSQTWGGDCTGIGSSCQVTMDADKAVSLAMNCELMALEQSDLLPGQQTWQCSNMQAIAGFSIQGANRDVQFEATTGIELGPGFRVGNQALFKAKVSP